jgi:uncharacterized repeat protein (TIGR03806 family)
MAFSLPMDLRQPPTEPLRWFVAERDGTLKAFTLGDTTARVVTKIPNVNGNGEGGFLGFAFSPKWPAEKQIYVSYTSTSASSPANMRSVIARLTSADGVNFDATGPNLEELLSIDQPYTNHNGGGIAFGPDGMLYVGFGDGGSAGDPQGNGQNKDTLLGKFIRLDVSRTESGLKYGIPPSNPYAQPGSGGRKEIYALGMRNPWRWSFDTATGDLWAADVGQGLYEEIDLIKRGGNYGWKIREGQHCFPTSVACSSLGLTDPVLEYPRSDGVSVTGGYVYRGTKIPSLIGKFIFGDYGTGRIWRMDDDGKAFSKTELAVVGGASLNTFGQDLAGEIYVVNIGSGVIQRLAPEGPAVPSTFPTLLSKTGCVRPEDPKQMAAGVLPYVPNAPFWSDGAAKERFFALPDGKTITIKPDGDWEFPQGSVLIKTFSVAGKRVETRLYMLHSDNTWAGYSYEWNDAETDAVLLLGSKTKRVGLIDWQYPSRSQCNRCHTQAAGFSLGLETAQLNGDFVYVASNRKSNQLATLDHIGVFAAPIASPTTLPQFSNPYGTEGTLEARARAYLHSNCSYCHRPEGGGRGELDLRFTTPLALTKTCGKVSEVDDLGIAGAKVIDPGKPENSILFRRMTSEEPAVRMPPLSSRIVDSAGAKLLEAWIKAQPVCP